MIATILKRSVSTIGLELKRNYGCSARSYNGERAQKLAEQRRRDSKEPRIGDKIWEEVFHLYNEDWSPEQIANRVKISHETIYRRIYTEIKAGWSERVNSKGTFWKKFP